MEHQRLTATLACSQGRSPPPTPRKTRRHIGANEKLPSSSLCFSRLTDFDPRLLMCRAGLELFYYTISDIECAVNKYFTHVQSVCIHVSNMKDLKNFLRVQERHFFEYDGVKITWPKCFLLFFVSRTLHNKGRCCSTD